MSKFYPSIYWISKQIFYCPPYSLLTNKFQVMLRFIVNNGRCKDAGGIALWQLMEERQVLHSHSWQSMKEKFRSSIVGNLDFFDFLTKEEKRELRKHKARHVPTAPL